MVEKVGATHLGSRSGLRCSQTAGLRHSETVSSGKVLASASSSPGNSAAESVIVSKAEQSKATLPHKKLQLPACSEKIKAYFIELDARTKVAYELATRARQKGYDPEERVDIPLTASVPERSELLIASQYPELENSGCAARIADLEKEYTIGDWRIALIVAHEIAAGKIAKFEDQITAINAGVKVGFAYLTLGVVAAPLEGLVEIKFKDRKDGGQYLAAYYAGPVRGAGGTAAAVSVLIADYVRYKLGIPKYDITDLEVKRYQMEIEDYLRLVGHRQYVPTPEELEFMLTRIGVEINGDPTENYEVSRYKDVDRVGTSKIRGGMVLVVTEGPTLKAEKILAKLKKWGKSFDFPEWDWMEDFVKLKHKLHYAATKSVEGEDEAKVKPGMDYLRDIVAGRPVFGQPLRNGGFRLRYGRVRTSGFAAMAMSPVTLKILNDYVATGTQLKVERPGKATIINPCDTIEGPMVRLKNGDFLRLESEEQAVAVRKNIEEIVFLGDVLICYGDFSENGKKLVPPGYCEEWWAVELEAAMEKRQKNADKEPLKNSITDSKANQAASPLVSDEKLLAFVKSPLDTRPTFEQAVEISQQFKVPLHPAYIFHWLDVEKARIASLRDWLAKDVASGLQGREMDAEVKKTLEWIGCAHMVKGNKILLDKNSDRAMRFQLGLAIADDGGAQSNDSKKGASGKVNMNSKESNLTLINKLSPVEIRDRSGTYIGMRMGRPEKAKMRMMKGSPHGLFPVGKEGDRTRSVQKAQGVGYVTSQFPTFSCPKCSNRTIYPVCERCGERTTLWRRCPVCKKQTTDKKCHAITQAYERKRLDIHYYINNAKNYLGIRQLAPLIKGVVGTWNKDHIVENFSKILLRARHGVYVNKDGTIRYDMTETATTHFTPSEVGTSVRKLKELGYAKDIHGKPLENADQLLEIFPQDVILPACKEAEQDGADVVLLKVANFIDELLTKFYRLEPYYNLKTSKDLVGQLIVGLAPHTSAGIIGRIIGFSNTQGCYSHPYWHAAQRRNLDGDETCVILAMDAFLNFSRQFLPDRRGGRSMDAPLVMTTIMNTTEVDDEVHGMDIAWRYPLEFYEAAMAHKWPWDVKVRQVATVLDTPAQYEGLGFTHSVSSINSGVRVSAYKFIPTMIEKLDGQIDLARRIRAVDLADVGRLVIEKHFLKDIKGNLRKWSLQQYRCVKCNEKFRRPPLAGKCSVCSGKLLFTIAEGSIKKYMEPSKKLARECGVSPYLKQTLEILGRRIDEVFGIERTKATSLNQFFK